MNDTNCNCMNKVKHEKQPKNETEGTKVNNLEAVFLWQPEQKKYEVIFISKL